MKNSLSLRDSVSIAARAMRIFVYEEAGLYYPWGLGYNHMIDRKDLEAALVNSQETK